MGYVCFFVFFCVFVQIIIFETLIYLVKDHVCSSRQNKRNGWKNVIFKNICYIYKIPFTFLFSLFRNLTITAHGSIIVLDDAITAIFLCFCYLWQSTWCLSLYFLYCTYYSKSRRAKWGSTKLLSRILYKNTFSYLLNNHLLKMYSSMTGSDANRNRSCLRVCGCTM